jgi:hypothetical protein
VSGLAIGATIALAVFAALGWMIWLIKTAPVGHETETGFHFGEPHSDYDGDA